MKKLPRPGDEIILRRAPYEAMGVTSNRALMFAVFGGAAAWTVDELAAFAWHQDYCATTRMTNFVTVSRGAAVAILVLISVIMLGIAIAALVVGWRARAILGKGDGRGLTDVDRRQFMATSGLIMSALFTYGIVLRGIAVVVMHTNLCSR
jgi:hypothetical protein